MVKQGWEVMKATNDHSLFPLSHFTLCNKEWEREIESLDSILEQLKQSRNKNAMF